jgi:pyruvate dehydrogenase kinase 2/3/4
VVTLSLRFFFQRTRACPRFVTVIIWRLKPFLSPNLQILYGTIFVAKILSAMATALLLSRSLRRSRALQLSARFSCVISSHSGKVKILQATVALPAQPKNEFLRVRRLSTVSATNVKIKDDDELVVDMEALKALAAQSPTPLRLKDMHHYAVNGDAAQRLRNAQFLIKELPIRMARRAMDLLTLPKGLNQTPAIRNVARQYLKYIEMLQSMDPPTTDEEERAFTDLLKSIVIDRKSIPMTISQGVSRWLESRKEEIDQESLQEMEDALYRFFTARAGLRFLMQHHILSDPHRKPEDLLSHLLPFSSSNKLGCIQTDCDPVKEVRTVIENVTQQTKDCYGVCPYIELVDSRTNKGGFTYPPHHLQYMVAELLKNSCRATVERYSGSDETMPPIRVVVTQGHEDVSIKVADNGGGAPRSVMEKIWKFAHSTSPDLEENTDFGKDAFSGGKIRGFGLPLARIYARYFGGELTLLSTEGQGVDAYLYLPRLGSSCEKLHGCTKNTENL